METKSPWEELVECCFYEGIYKLVSGEVPLDGIPDFIDQRIEELMNTNDFKRMIDEYFDNFIDVKSLHSSETYPLEEIQNDGNN